MLQCQGHLSLLRGREMMAMFSLIQSLATKSSVCRVFHEVKHRCRPSVYWPQCTLLNFVKKAKHSTSVAIKAGFHSKAVGVIFIPIQFVHRVAERYLAGIIRGEWVKFQTSFISNFQIPEKPCQQISNMTVFEEKFVFLSTYEWIHQGEYKILEREDDNHLSLAFCYYRIGTIPLRKHAYSTILKILPPNK